MGAADTRFLEVAASLLDLGLAKTERQLALELRQPAAVIYKVRKGIQAYPKSALAALATRFGVNPQYVTDGKLPMYRSTPQAVSDRLALAVERLGHTLTQASMRVGLSEERFANLLARPNRPTAQELDLIARAYPTISLAWLLSGEGASGLPEGAHAVHPIPSLAAQATPPGFALLPFVDYPARASFVSDHLHGLTFDQLERRAIMLDPTLKGIKQAVIIEVEGDSMSPTLLPGDKLVVTPISQADWGYESGGIYVVVFGEHLLVKRIKRNALLSNGIIELASDNPQSGTLEVPGTDLRALYKLRQLVRVIT